ncbi:MAG: carboxypeptidase-like regulatory domain-containing protein [Pirellulales bacterium]
MLSPFSQYRSVPSTLFHLEKSLAWICAVIVITTVLAGCGSKGPSVYSVTGTVTVDGTPLPNVQVAFLPTESNRQASLGVTDASGKFDLTYGSSDRKGAEPGSYKVVLTQLSNETEEEAMARYSGSGAPEAEQKQSFPTEYASPEQTPKQVEVSATSNVIDIAI